MNADIESELLSQIEQARAGKPKTYEVGRIAIGDRVTASDFEAERRGVFARSFLPVARESDLEQPGAVRTVEVAGHQLLLVRSEDGVLRAFRNVCPHRGAVLVRCAEGSRDKLVCPYHGFTYDLTGKLLSVADPSSFGAALEGVGLQQLDMSTALGWCWVRPEAGEESLSDLLGSRLLADLEHWELEGADRKHSESVECEFNWKIGVEAFLESLHLPTIHKRTAHPLIDFSATAFDTFESHSMMATPFRSANSYTDDGPIGDAAKQAGVSNFPRLNTLQRTSNLSYLIFPSTVLSFLPNHFTVFSLLPLSESRTRFTWEIYGAPAESTAAVQYYESMRAGYEGLVREDLANLPWIDKGVRDPSVQPPLLSRHEMRIRAFREAVRSRCH